MEIYACYIVALQKSMLHYSNLPVHGSQGLTDYQDLSIRNRDFLNKNDMNWIPSNTGGGRYGRYHMIGRNWGISK